jgi:predicted O-methyltransferase YrrM
MSEGGSYVAVALADYVAAHTLRDDDFLAELKQAARAAELPPIWIAPAQASLMQILLRLMGARVVVEVGTLAGYSAIVLARSLPPEGRVHTIEIDPRRADFAERWIARSDVAGKIAVHRGAAIQVLPGFAGESADAAFLDADKGNYSLYLRESLRIVRPRGLIMADNAFAFGQVLDEHAADPDVAAMRAFNEQLAHLPGLRSVIAPLGDGLWIGVKE